MARIIRPPGRRREPPSSRQRLPGSPAPPGRPAGSLWVVAAIALLLAGVPLLLFNQHHSGDPLKIRRELRKF